MQNDVIALIDDAGETVVEYKYDSWGKILSITGSKASTIGKTNPFRYRGYYYDEETENVYYGYLKEYPEDCWVSANGQKMVPIGFLKDWVRAMRKILLDGK